MSKQPLISSGASFDSLGPTVRVADLPTGRRVRFIDDGPSTGHTLLFFGGAGTTVRAAGLMGFAESLRAELAIRMVSVERNGLGDTPFDPAVDMSAHAEDVWALLDQLGVESVSVVAISGGGPYAAHVMAQHPARIRSVHLACAYSERLAALPESAWSVEEIAADPVRWWTFGPDSAVHAIPGFVDRVVEEATRGMFARGRDIYPDGLRQAFDFYANQPLPDLSEVPGPVVLYWGEQDDLVPLAHACRWERALAKPCQRRFYPGEGHDVQYRHWDQILVDVSHGPEWTLLSKDGLTFLVQPVDVSAALDDGAVVGIWAWSSTAIHDTPLRQEELLGQGERERHARPS